MIQRINLKVENAQGSNVSNAVAEPRVSTRLAACRFLNPPVTSSHRVAEPTDPSVAFDGPTLAAGTSPIFGVLKSSE